MRRPSVAGVRPSAVLLAVLAIAASGCGGGNGPSQSSQASSPPAAGSRYEGGEKSIEGFGREAVGSDRATLLMAFHGYLAAIAARRYATACSHLGGAVRRSLQRLAGGRGAGLDCAAILPQFLSPTAATIAGQQLNGKVTKVRVEGDRAFVVFRAPGARLFQLTMTHESGDWRASTVAASVLVPSPATLGE